jgi:hypothetical protein
MDQGTLRERLAKLHAELDTAHRDNPDARESLGGILPDVKRLVDQPAADRDASLTDRLEKVAVQFEADHPTLAGSARRLIDLLGEVGI